MGEFFPFREAKGTSLVAGHMLATTVSVVIMIMPMSVVRRVGLWQDAVVHFGTCS